MRNKWMETGVDVCDWTIRNQLKQKKALEQNFMKRTAWGKYINVQSLMVWAYMSGKCRLDSRHLAKVCHFRKFLFHRLKGCLLMMTSFLKTIKHLTREQRTWNISLRDRFQRHIISLDHNPAENLCRKLQHAVRGVKLMKKTVWY